MVQIDLCVLKRKQSNSCPTFWTTVYRCVLRRTLMLKAVNFIGIDNNNQPYQLSPPFLLTLKWTTVIQSRRDLF